MWRTVVNVHVGPERLALANDASSFAVERGFDEVWDLDRVRVRDPGVEESALRDAVDGGG